MLADVGGTDFPPHLRPGSLPLAAFDRSVPPCGRRRSRRQLSSLAP